MPKFHATLRRSPVPFWGVYLKQIKMFRKVNNYIHVSDFIIKKI